MAKVDIKKKAQTDFPDFVSVVDAMGVQALNDKLLAYAKEEQRVVEALEEDQEIKNTQEKLKELKGPYNDAKKALKIKMRYIGMLIKEKGGEA